MIHAFIHALAGAMLLMIRQTGYIGIAALMMLESACIPIPSEVIMTFSGYLASTKALGLFGVIAAGTIGNVAGSLAAYALGAYGGLPFLRRHGRKILISPHDLDSAHAWFARHGHAAVFLGRLLPILRTFISLPAGVARMPLAAFIAYSAAGSLVWCAVLAWVGLRLGQHWQALSPYMHGVDNAVAGGLMVFLVLAVRRHRRAARKPPIAGDQRKPGAESNERI
ncbi:MAG: DedA family protein [Gammaproteobacteria bacterium]|uniref:DedA family protein n=1 Tax=Acidiferrobacter sp. TaxID=1872107 RepID=UPI0023214755|nr:DedA family protein [Acidiferrobacter sp.]MDA8120518.1 DedA family protein [Gammaproteobacteria bacterium]